MPFIPTREEQLSEKKLKWGYWWVTHKIQVRRWFGVAMIVLDVALVGYAVYGFADWYLLSGVQERATLAQLVQNPIDYAFFRQKLAPANLTIDNPLVLPAGEGAFDMASKVTNDNTRWWAEFDYRYILNEDPSQSPKAAHAFVLPGDTTYVSALGWKISSTPAPRLEISDFIWHRITAHEIQPNYEAYKAARLNLLIVPEPFRPALASDPLHVSRAVFKVTNDTGFGYRDARFFVLLKSDEAVVGVGDVTVGRLTAGETRTVEASWFSDLPAVTGVEVMPIINIMDPSVFITVGE